jgi:hypothetical protein
MNFMNTDDPIDTDALDKAAALTRRQEMANKAAEVADGLVKTAAALGKLRVLAADNSTLVDFSMLGEQARDVAAYLKEQAE